MMLDLSVFVSCCSRCVRTKQTPPLVRRLRHEQATRGSLRGWAVASCAWLSGRWRARPSRRARCRSASAWRGPPTRSRSFPSCGRIPRMTTANQARLELRRRRQQRVLPVPLLRPRIPLRCLPRAQRRPPSRRASPKVTSLLPRERRTWTLRPTSRRPSRSARCCWRCPRESLGRSGAAAARAARAALAAPRMRARARARGGFGLLVRRTRRHRRTRTSASCSDNRQPRP